MEEKGTKKKPNTNKKTNNATSKNVVKKINNKQSQVKKKNNQVQKKNPTKKPQQVKQKQQSQQSKQQVKKKQPVQQKKVETQKNIKPLEEKQERILGDDFLNESNVQKVTSVKEITNDEFELPRLKEEVLKDLENTHSLNEILKEDYALPEETEVKQRKEIEVSKLETKEPKKQEIKKIEEKEETFDKVEVKEIIVEKIEPNTIKKSEIKEKTSEKPSIKEKNINNNINMNTNKNVKTINVKKIIKGVSISLFMILAVSAIIFSLSVFKINMLPTKYLLIFNGVLLAILFGIFLLANGHKKKTNFVGSVLSIILTIVFAIGSSFVLKTNGTLKDFFTQSDVEIEYKLLVENTSTYNNIKDLKTLNVGILRENSVNVKEYLEKYEINVNIYDTLGELTLSLGTDNQGIAINKDMIATINELDVEFTNKVKDIHDFKLKVGKDIERPVVEEVPDPEETEEQKRIREEQERRKAELSNLVKGNSFIVYISGIDASGGNSAANAGLSDVNMLAIVNPDTNKLLLVSIPRDFYVYVNGKKDKLTHAGLYGINTSVKTIENLFNIKVDYYLKVCFGAVTTLVDDIDGIEVYSDTAFTSSHMPSWYVNQGMVQMDGRKALAYARERYAYSGGDRHRIKNQQDVIDAIISKVSKNTGYLLKFNDILNHVNPYVATSIPYDKMQSLVKKQIDTLSGWSVSKYSVDGYNSWNYSASFPASPAYVMEPNYQTVFTAQDKIISIIKG